MFAYLLDLKYLQIVNTGVHVGLVGMHSTEDLFI